MQRYGKLQASKSSRVDAREIDEKKMKMEKEESDEGCRCGHESNYSRSR